MKRNEIDKKYQWHLQDIYPSEDLWESDYAFVRNETKKLASFKGKLNKADCLYDCLKLNSALLEKLYNMYGYAHMNKDTDGANDKYVSLMNRIESLLSEVGTAAAFIESEIVSLDQSYVRDCICDPKFSEYDFMLKEILRNGSHILSEKEERLLSMSQSPMSDFQTAFATLNNVEFPFPYIKADGEKVKLTHGLYSYYMQSKDPKTRKAAFDGMYKTLRSLINTITVLYAGSVKKDNFYAKARGFRSRMEMSLFNDDVPVEVYDNLVKAVKKSTKQMHDYIALRKKILGFKTMHMYDLYLPIIDGVDMSVDYEKAYEYVLEGLKPMGEEYRNLLIAARDEGWIDVFENDGKRSGAYSSSVYGTHPYVLLNYSRTMHDIFTIAHELGHAMHSYYSNKTQCFPKADYAIFVAEVASTVNEVLLLKHFIATAPDKKTKQFFLNYYLDMFRTTIFRQTMFAEFEKITHEMEQKGIPLTVNSMSDAYYKLNKAYYGKALKHDEDIKYEWARIPHFYTSFYVYKYATGLTSAVNIANRILRDPSFVNVYRDKFLSAGGSDSPYNILKNVGVDLACTEPYEFAMKEFADTLEELKAELE